MLVRLAAYGTLMTGQHNQLPAAVRRRMHSMGFCEIPGRLFRVPGGFAYPALVCMPGHSTRGELFVIPADDLKIIDAYEDCRPAAPQASMYVRRLLPVENAVGTVRAWVYLWNRPVLGLVPVPGNRRVHGVIP
jgi:gamma-glutamylcyclotransferase (GGCT)/AIG2-like uncharacterized protein YtfP